MAGKKLSEIEDKEMIRIIQLATDLDTALAGTQEGGVKIALQDFLKDAWEEVDRRDSVGYTYTEYLAEFAPNKPKPEYRCSVCGETSFSSTQCANYCGIGNTMELDSEV